MVHGQLTATKGGTIGRRAADRAQQVALSPLPTVALLGLVWRAAGHGLLAAGRVLRGLKSEGRMPGMAAAGSPSHEADLAVAVSALKAVAAQMRALEPRIEAALVGPSSSAEPRTAKPLAADQPRANARAAA